MKNTPPSLDPGFEALRDLQRRMAEALFLPLGRGERMQRHLADGRDLQKEAEEYIKPNDRLTSFERLEIYSRGYWFRILDCLYDDFPGLKAVLGQRRFHKLATAYLQKYPSASYTLRNLGSRLEAFSREAPEWLGPKGALALDMIRFEWAQIEAFDSGAHPPIAIDELLGSDPSQLRLRLQPYITLLELGHPVDDLSMAVKAKDADALSTQSSNAVEGSRPTKSPGRVRLPRPKQIWLAVHRHENGIYLKRLTAAQYALLSALKSGATVEIACGLAYEREPSDPGQFSENIRQWFHSAGSLGWFHAHEENAAPAFRD